MHVHPRLIVVVPATISAMAAKEAVPTEKSLPVVHCEIIQAVEGRGAVNIFVICLDRCGSEHNIIDRQFGLEFTQAVYLAGEKAGSGEADVLVLCSAKERSFLAGADIEEELKFIGPEGTRRWVELDYIITQWNLSIVDVLGT